MSLVEEDLPGVHKVRSDFQVREDESLAHQLQEEEFEEHYNSNVQLRRTARVDATVAIDLQKTEVEIFRSEEAVRRGLIEAKEQQDREHAEELTKKIQEEEDVEHAMKLQDEVMAKTLFAKDQQKVISRRQQEEEDSRLARQSSLVDTQAARERRQKDILSEQAAKRFEMEERLKLENKHREEQLSETEAKRLHDLQRKAVERKRRELELGKPGAVSPQSGSPVRSGPSSLPSGNYQQRSAAPQRGNPSASLPVAALSSGHTRKQQDTVDYGGGSSIKSASVADSFQLPSYDDLVGGGGEEEVPVLDENDRIALQEAEDEKFARQLSQSGNSSERQRREKEDREYIQKMLEEEKKQLRRAQSPHHQRDEELAKRLQQQDLEARKKQKQQRSVSLDQHTTTLPGEDAASLELAKRLQKDEVIKIRQLKQQKLAQQRLIEAETEKRKQAPQSSTQPRKQAPSRQQGGTQPRQQSVNPAPVSIQPGQSSAQAGRGVATPVQHPSHTAHTQGEVPQYGQSTTIQQPMVSSYQPAMVGHQVPLASQNNEGVPQARPSYKRDQKKKGKK